MCLFNYKSQRFPNAVLVFDNLAHLNSVVELSRGIPTPMTLIETVSFNASDFTENFLTCPTCLSNYDEQLKLPKLLPCSHTVCIDCLERIIRIQGQINEAFRCPICRETILLPRGGVASLPPSYIVNRLMDLLKCKMQRDFVPKCAIHTSEVLLFCETCDTIFCPVCESHQLSTEHIVVPFALAIKRMSEILQYKASQCRSCLQDAINSIKSEMERLEDSVDKASKAVSQSFSEICSHIDRRRNDILSCLRRLKDQKMFSLSEQLELVLNEQRQLECECEKLQRNPDIRALTEQIEALNARIESSQLLAEPRENSFLKFEFRHNNALAELCRATAAFGRVRVSNTYPPLCTATLDGSVANVRCMISVTAMDYNGNVQNVGGDPLTVSVTDPNDIKIPYTLSDTLTGAYNICFLPSQPGRYKVDVRIFNRPIRGSPLNVDISDHNNPLWTTGSRGSGSKFFNMPVGIVFHTNFLYVLDTGNRRILKLSPSTGATLGELVSDPVITNSTTGLCGLNDLLYTVDWRSHRLLSIRVSDDGNEAVEVKELVHEYAFFEPVGIAINCDHHIFVLDTKTNFIVILDINGCVHNVLSFGSKPIRAFCASLNFVLFADSSGSLQSLNIESGERKLIREGCYTSVYVDNCERILASRSSRMQCIIEVIENESVTHCIDSYDEPLRRPSALTVDAEGHVFCTDLTAHCVRKYRYI